MQKVFLMIILVLEKLNLFAWIVFGLFGLLFLDSPKSSVKDLWFVLLIIIILTINLILSIRFIAQSSTITLNGLFIAGFFLSVVLSVPSFLWVTEKSGIFWESKENQESVEKFKKRGNVLSEKEIEILFKYFSANQGNPGVLEDFKYFLENNLVSSTVMLEHMLLDEFKIDFLKTLLDYHPDIKSHGDIIQALNVLQESARLDDKRFNVKEILRLLLDYGLNPQKKDLKQLDGTMVSGFDWLQEKNEFFKKRLEQETLNNLSKKNSFNIEFTTKQLESVDMMLKVISKSPNENNK